MKTQSILMVSVNLHQVYKRALLVMELPSLGEPIASVQGTLRTTPPKIANPRTFQERTFGGARRMWQRNRAFAIDLHTGESPEKSTSTRIADAR
jgi:hypothetical protein